MNIKVGDKVSTTKEFDTNPFVDRKPVKCGYVVDINKNDTGYNVATIKHTNGYDRIYTCFLKPSKI